MNRTHTMTIKRAGRDACAAVTLSLTLILATVANAGAASFTEPEAGAWKTWVISSGSQMRLAPPPDQYATAAELDHVRQAAASRDAPALADIAYWDAGPPAYRWMQIAAQEVAKRNLPGPLGTRAMALVATVIYDATIAAWDTKYTYNRPRPAELDPSIQPVVTVPNTPGYPSEHAATAAAAAAVLAYLFPDDADQFNQRAQHAANSRLLAGAEFPSDSTAGLQLGSAVGAAVVAYAKSDGSDAAFTASYPPSSGKWSSANPVTPLAGTWRPWLLSSGSQFRPAAPPPFDSPQMAGQLAMVKNLAHTTDVSRVAWIWQASFITPWLDTVNQKIFEYRFDTNAPRAARIYALATVAQHDATIACWDAKYAYLEMRPIMFDSTIATLFATPQHPSFPSGHACASGGSGAVLGYLFPIDAQFFNDRAVEAGTSTFDAGIHFPLDVDGGLALGRAVGQKVIDRASQDGAQ